MRHRPAIGIVAVSAALALAVAVPAAAATSGAAAATGSSAATGTSGGWATTRPACTDSATGARCLAVRLVRIAHDRPGAHRYRSVRQRFHVAAGPAGGYTPADLATAYGVNASAAVSQTVAIVDAYNDPDAREDLDTFDTHYGLRQETASSLRVVSQRGSSTALPADDTTGWSVEESLDLDAVRGLCHTCSIVLVEADSQSDGNLAAAENEAARLGADEITNSFGFSESDTHAAALAKAFDHKGIVITASTGDDGLFDWDYANEGVKSADAPDLPASLDTVVAVGGTSLRLHDNGTRASEKVWNDDGPEDETGSAQGKALGASGGGCSTQVRAQRWQRDVAGYGQTGCGTARLAADVSALADPVTGYDIFDSYQVPSVYTCSTPNCWTTVGGTSLASPLVAAMWALAGGAHHAAYPSLWLYGHRKTASSSIYDVTSGGNGFCDGVRPSTCGAVVRKDYDSSDDSPNQLGARILDCGWNASGSKYSSGTRECDAASGYDGPSGVGTPKGLGLFEPMAPRARIAVSGPLTRKRSVRFSDAGSSDPFPGGSIGSCSWNWGDGHRSTGCSAKHTYATKGIRKITLTVRDDYGVASSTTRTVTVR